MKLTQNGLLWERAAKAWPRSTAHQAKWVRSMVALRKGRGHAFDVPVQRLQEPQRSA